ncbi:MAG: hypothetical protein LBL07_09500 [Tannerella sp.]|nr:hypothetical protein [Tannerella sp.]
MAVVASELLEQVWWHLPRRLMLVDEADEVVNVAELLVDTAVPAADGGKDTCLNTAQSHCAQGEGKRCAATGCR